MDKQEIYKKFHGWRADWNLFAKEVLRVNLDPDQQAILKSVQTQKRVSVASGTARGKDFVAAVASICFLYLTPKWNDKGEMIENTKIAQTAPTDRQIGNIIFPEISRLFKQSQFLPGRLTGYDIRTDNEEWFLTGFKADSKNTEAWTGFHAVHTMFVVTEASGMEEQVFDAIEGNLQGDSRLLIVFNQNLPTGYAASSQRAPGWAKFRLSSLTAPNVIHKKNIIPGQVDYTWIKERIEEWCVEIHANSAVEENGDFRFEGSWYRPNDKFRIKVLGLPPLESSDVLVPMLWIEAANKRWQEAQKDAVIDRAGNTGTTAEVIKKTTPLRLGNDVAGMGRDSTSFVYRYGNFVEKIQMIHSGGVANHMEVVGIGWNILKQNTHSFSRLQAQWFIDTVGEGAGVLSRAHELADLEKEDKNVSIKIAKERIHSVKASEGGTWNGHPLKDYTGYYEFVNMRSYLAWAVRDWLNPLNKNNAMLPPDEELFQELSETKYVTKSNGKILIEPKEDIKKRIKRSPDKFDGLAMTFYPVPDVNPNVTAEAALANFLP